MKKSKSTKLSIKLLLIISMVVSSCSQESSSTSYGSYSSSPPTSNLSSNSNSSSESSGYISPKRWLADIDNGCLVYNPNPVANEQISWSGGCSNGYAKGIGIVTWYLNGKKTDQYRASLLNGKRIACVSGNCENGTGTYIYRSGGKYNGNWTNGKKNGKFTYTSPTGQKSIRYYAMDKNMTERVNDCKTANTAKNAYGAFVGGISVLFAIKDNKDIVSAYNWGVDASEKQSLPRAVSIYCD